MKNFFDGNDNIAEGKVGNTSKSSSCSPVDISIRPCSHGGFEILISNQIGEERCLLSSVLEVLIEESLTIVNCFCAKVNDKFIQTIQTEVPFLPSKSSYNAIFMIHDFVTISW